MRLSAFWVGHTTQAGRRNHPKITFSDLDTAPCGGGDYLHIRTVISLMKPRLTRSPPKFVFKGLPELF
ncbi:hypothetical protein SAMN03159496_05576 [Rhizobium sp. NFR07]|nr:hypothetical protein SAMN03159496_05576 [Rhizobium sp. NFR07]